MVLWLKITKLYHWNLPSNPMFVIVLTDSDYLSWVEGWSFGREAFHDLLQVNKTGLCGWSLITHLFLGTLRVFRNLSKFCQVELKDMARPGQPVEFDDFAALAGLQPVEFDDFAALAGLQPLGFAQKLWLPPLLEPMPHDKPGPRMHVLCYQPQGTKGVVCFVDKRTLFM